MEAHEIVSAVQDKYRGLAVEMDAITDKGASTYRSHCLEPKTRNPLASGNPSPVTHFMLYARQYEKAKPGAGSDLIDLVHSELEAEFSGDSDICSEGELQAKALKESFDVLQRLANCDFAQLSIGELLTLETDCDEMADIAILVKTNARRVRREKEMERRNR